MRRAPPPVRDSFLHLELNELFRRDLAVAIEIGRARVTFRGHLRPFGRIQATILIRVVPDRKSTRLNSSHVKISYAVFCLKKKKTNIRTHKYNNNDRHSDN